MRVYLCRIVFAFSLLALFYLSLLLVLNTSFSLLIILEKLLRPEPLKGSRNGFPGKIR